MGCCIVKLNGLYLEWSSFVDAAVTPLMTREEMTDYQLAKATSWLAAASGTPREGVARIELDHEKMMLRYRFERADQTGTSQYANESAEDCVHYNRMGPNEGRLSLKNVIKKCLADREEWGLPPLTEEIEGAGV